MDTFLHVTISIDEMPQIHCVTRAGKHLSHSQSFALSVHSRLIGHICSHLVELSFWLSQYDASWKLSLGEWNLEMKENHHRNRFHLINFHHRAVATTESSSSKHLWHDWKCSFHFNRNNKRIIHIYEIENRENCRKRHRIDTLLDHTITLKNPEKQRKKFCNCLWIMK